MKPLHIALLVLALPSVCFAQWQWVDKDGRKVYSDQAPPPSIPAKNILRQPGVKGIPPAAAEAAAAEPAKPQASAPKLSGKDKQLEEKKKQLEAAAAEKKKAEDEEREKLRADNCSRAKVAKASFDSGARIQRVNAKGEREFLDDPTRAAEVKRLETIIASDCKPAGG
jgi:type IV secretory pathway VirB10-like protein